MQQEFHQSSSDFQNARVDGLPEIQELRELIGDLSDPEQTFRRKALAKLGQLGQSAVAALPVVIERLTSDRNSSVREAAACSLGLIGDPRAVPALLDSFRSDVNYDVRLGAAHALARIGDSSAVPALTEVLEPDTLLLRIGDVLLESVSGTDRFASRSDLKREVLQVLEEFGPAAAEAAVPLSRILKASHPGRPRDFLPQWKYHEVEELASMAVGALASIRSNDKTVLSCLHEHFWVGYREREKQLLKSGLQDTASWHGNTWDYFCRPIIAALGATGESATPYLTNICLRFPTHKYESAESPEEYLEAQLSCMGSHAIFEVARYLSHSNGDIRRRARSFLYCNPRAALILPYLYQTYMPLPHRSQRQPAVDIIASILNEKSIPKDLAGAIGLLESKARQGDAHAQYSLALMYHFGSGVPQDQARTFSLLQNLADRRVVRVEFSQIFERGEGTVRNYERAFQLYKEIYSRSREYAHRDGDLYGPDKCAAAYALSRLYAGGQGVPRSHKEAAFYLMEAQSPRSPRKFYYSTLT